MTSHSLITRQSVLDSTFNSLVSMHIRAHTHRTLHLKLSKTRLRRYYGGLDELICSSYYYYYYYYYPVQAFVPILVEALGGTSSHSRHSFRKLEARMNVSNIFVSLFMGLDQSSCICSRAVVTSISISLT